MSLSARSCGSLTSSRAAATLLPPRCCSAHVTFNHVRASRATSASVPCTASVLSATASRSSVVPSAGKGFGVSNKKQAMDGALPCPCGSGSLYGACCAPMHAGTSVAATPLELLRSRYCAYVLRLPDYVVDTTSPECEEWPGVRSTYLSTVRAAQKQMLCEGMTLIDDPPGAPAATSIDEAYISFKVIFGNLQRQKATGAPVAPRVERMERSLFKRTKGRWAYVSSEVGSNMLPPI